ncbi:lytic polysaccharide monooxygenase [Candidatus Symbiopectobacterium sp. NZEC135]|uniref:lytic polysaccharide monooxygenase n=1 Tax=Candidatus Symbiopectobacterium sp. NZEC135 TaxID=2820471 RepID=UPI0022272864|nr:lytic polysaccharide monooxygenase [Candidatus Symbiopectobacterium sp. NZEC135]MCW2481761.1 lytic polysaccharide monooxygenase [Candidatus Symbiopectobacterium sp. NZEC135]
MKHIVLLLLTLFVSSYGVAEEVVADAQAVPPESPYSGYISSPPSRVILCTSDISGINNINCGPAKFQPQYIEGPRGFPVEGPPDGKIASAGNPQFSQLDAQSANRWYKSPMNPGYNTFTWTMKAPYNTYSWQFFITKQNWNPNAPLTRASFEPEPFCMNYVPVDSTPLENTSTDCVVPQRTGYQVILGVWTVSDKADAFYQVLDVNFGS